MKKHTIQVPGKRHRNRPSRMSDSEIMTILILFHTHRFRDLKSFYLGYVCQHMRKDFPNPVSYNRFVELTGKKPGYLHAHSISSEPYEETIHEISAATGIPYSFDVIQKFHIVSAWDKVDPMADKASGKKVFDPTAQLSKDSFSINVADVSDYLLSHEYAMVLGHPGYVDADLMGRTSLSLERMRDAEMMMSQQFKDWIRDHHVQLITYRDLVEEE